MSTTSSARECDPTLCVLMTSPQTTIIIDTIWYVWFSGCYKSKHDEQSILIPVLCISRCPLWSLWRQRCFQRIGYVLPREGGRERNTWRSFRSQCESAGGPGRVGDAVHLWVKALSQTVFTVHICVGFRLASILLFSWQTSTIISANSWSLVKSRQSTRTTRKQRTKRRTRSWVDHIIIIMMLC